VEWTAERERAITVLLDRKRPARFGRGSELELRAPLLAPADRWLPVNWHLSQFPADPHAVGKVSRNPRFLVSVNTPATISSARMNPLRCPPIRSRMARPHDGNQRGT
jgi:hypothetical protein